MKTKFLIFTLLVSFWLSAQKKPEYSLALDSQISNVYLHQATGIPVVTTGGGVYGVNGATGEKIWEFKESSLTSTLNALGQDGGSSFKEVSFSPFGQFKQTVFNIKSGDVILSPDKQGFSKIVDSYYVLGSKAILFTTRGVDKNIAKLFLVKIEDNSIAWEKTLKQSKKIKTIPSTGYAQTDSHIGVVLGSNFALLDKNSGAVIANEKFSAGMLFFSEDGSKLFAVEGKGASLVGGMFKVGATKNTEVSFGEKVRALDVATGKSIWKKDIKLEDKFVDAQFLKNNLVLIDKEGVNYFDLNTGKPIWKKAISKKKVKYIESHSEGYVVYFKNKKQLFDHSGKRLQKRPEKVIKNVGFEVADDEDFTVFKYDRGVIFVTPFRIEYFEKGKEKRVYKIAINDEDKIAFDEKNMTLVLLRSKNFYLLNPDKDLGKEQKNKIKFKDHKSISSLEIRDQNYFINGPWEYALLDFKGNLVKNKYYRQPGEGLRLAKNIGSAVFVIAGEASIWAGRVNAANGATFYGAGTLIGHRQAKEYGRKTYRKGARQYYAGEAAKEIGNLLYDDTRYNASRKTKDFAFFYASINGKKTLVQVDKNNGEEVDGFEFGVNEPKYIIDDIESRIYLRKKNQLHIYSY